jgi:hypothetical protein
MDLTQNKLSKAEWNSIEVPVSDDEKRILRLIDDSCTNINIKTNDHLSMIQYIKLDKNAFNESYLYTKYFQDSIHAMLQKYKGECGDASVAPFAAAKIEQKNLKMVKKADMIRVENMNVAQCRHLIFEFLLLDFCAELMNKLAPMEPTYTIKKQKSTASKTTASKTTASNTSVPTNQSYIYYLYTLVQFKKLSIHHINPHVTAFVDSAIQYASRNTRVSDIIRNASQTIEQNTYLLKYDDLTLYSHQKQLFSITSQHRVQPKQPITQIEEILAKYKYDDEFVIPETVDEQESVLKTLEKKHGAVDKTEKVYSPKLILYTAPTGTGKTLSPVGLTKDFRVIFVCVARHVGLALAKAAISIEKKIAFAFGCETASDIRLHYYAATDYTVNYKTGGIYKVDNSVGDKVEMMICDVKSYLVAMRYMLAFNKESNIITYWDEPTITMDYETHELHPIIHQNWVENKISKMVLSCATLPKEDDIADTIVDFRGRFERAEVYTIASYDCKKSIKLMNKDIKQVVPHLLFSSYDDLAICVNHCEENKSLLRYFDLQEIVRYILYVNQHPGALPESYQMESYFDHQITNVTMHSIKLYYLECLSKMNRDLWNREIFQHLVSTQPISTVFQKTQSLDQVAGPGLRQGNPIVRSQSVAGPTYTTNPLNGVLLTTTDAHTLTDGPTIYLAEDIQKIGQLCIQQTKIPEQVFSDLMQKIEHNNVVQKKLDVLDKQLEDKLGKEIDKSKKMEREHFSGEVRTVMNEISMLRGKIYNVVMDSAYIPNTKQHQQLWMKNQDPVPNAFVPKIEETVVKDIMMVDVETNMKLLLLLGVGMFDKTTNIQYMEIMKKLADQQKLFLIIAGSDYIYGTNYQFCHGFIGKDLQNMTQQKIIQAMGRIGRNNIQQDYSIRFRDDDMLKSLFHPPAENREAIIMSQLFCSDL